MTKDLPNTRIRLKYSTAFELCTNEYIGDECSTKMLEFLKIVETKSDVSNTEQMLNEIRKIIEKIGLFIKKRLTEEDIEVLESVLSEINSVAENLSKKIDDQIENSMEMEQKTEVKINERLRNKLRKKIKEIVRTHLLNNR
jgi:chromosome condensin MukBEF ATPase and DNA-binding subunit MukB